jgi:CDP-diglyceride synthetase
MHMAQRHHQEAGLHWLWVGLSVAAGLLVVGASYYVVAPMFKNPQIQALVMLVGFIIAGAVIGYFSPGVTIKEAGIGGTLVAIIVLTVISLTKADVQFSGLTNVLLLVLGIVFSFVGGWIGEKLQGDEESKKEKHATHFMWKWVIIGVIVGFALNVMFVFLLAPLLKVNLMLVFIAFLVSFIVTGFIVGFKSPGVTLWEPAVAGLFSVVLDWLFLEVVITLHVDVSYVITGIAFGFLLNFLGAWSGERYQSAMEKGSKR